jgi:hypothetical protein
MGPADGTGPGGGEAAIKAAEARVKELGHVVEELVRGMEAGSERQLMRSLRSSQRQASASPGPSSSCGSSSGSLRCPSLPQTDCSDDVVMVASMASPEGSPRQGGGSKRIGPDASASGDDGARHPLVLASPRSSSFHARSQAELQLLSSPMARASPPSSGPARTRQPGDAACSSTEGAHAAAYGAAMAAEAAHERRRANLLARVGTRVASELAEVKAQWEAAVAELFSCQIMAQAAKEVRGDCGDGTSVCVFVCVGGGGGGRPAFCASQSALVHARCLPTPCPTP